MASDETGLSKLTETLKEYRKQNITILPITQEPPEDGYDGN